MLNQLSQFMSWFFHRLTWMLVALTAAAGFHGHTGLEFWTVALLP